MGLTYDPDEAVAALCRADPRMARLVGVAGPFTMRSDRSLDVFQALLRSIVFQQLSGKAASTILGRVLDLWGGRFPTPEGLASVDEADLRAKGLSRNKALAVHDLAHKAADGVVPTISQAGRLSDDVLVERLTSIRGVGVWTVEMLLLFRLGRPDVWPVTDLGVRKGYALLTAESELPTPKALLEAGEKWRPFRSVAAWYLWRAVDIKTPF